MKKLILSIAMMFAFATSQTVIAQTAMPCDQTNVAKDPCPPTNHLPSMPTGQKISVPNRGGNVDIYNYSCNGECGQAQQRPDYYYVPAPIPANTGYGVWEMITAMMLGAGAILFICWLAGKFDKNPPPPATVQEVHHHTHTHANTFTGSNTITSTGPATVICERRP